jgi:L,D-transpeptidase catalytic domain
MLRSAYVTIAGLAALIAAGDHVGATDRRSERSVESVESRIAVDPIMAIVSLHNQRITVYDANGWVSRAPVSSGQKGRETPAGIFSVIQKEAEHYSNLYDDAYMPHMQRITWSGIALHGGSLPGYPASHGCVRMPFDFAARLFDATRLGLRVIVAPTDVAPTEIAHPVLLSLSKPGAGSLAAAHAAEADEAAREAARRADQARVAAVMASREAARATMQARVAENLKLRAEEQLAAAQTALASGISAEAKEQAEGAKAQAVARIAELQAQWATAKTELQLKLDAVTFMREAAVSAEAARVAAADAARQVAHGVEPLSLLISRKTKRLYVRQAFEPILESPVTILDADRPIGTHIFTAMERPNGDTNMRWEVVSLDRGRPKGRVTERQGTTRGGRDVEPMLTDPGGAKAALDRIVIPPDVLDHIADMVPRSSLIITDEALSSETGNNTDFVVLLSGEPQGGIKFRHRDPGLHDRLPYWRSPLPGPFSIW